MSNLSFDELDQLLNDSLVARGARTLTASETQLIQPVYGKAVDLSLVRIRRGPILTVFSDALTIRNTISYDRNSYQDDFSKIVNDMALLCHELCHVWQHQNPKIDYNYGHALREHLKYGDAVYDYEPLDTSKCLIDYRFEQQGKILQDYYFKRAAGNDVTDLETVIYSSIER